MITENYYWSWRVIDMFYTPEVHRTSLGTVAPQGGAR
jgi:hypothetical protein